MMVTLTTVNMVSEADLIAGLLDAHGIRVLIPDQGIVTANPLYINTVGGIRVQVHKDDLAKARDVWKAYHQIED